MMAQTEELLPFEKIKREIIVKKRAETSEKFGCLPERRSVDEILNYGIINIDKPRGPTSHQVSAYVQGILNIKKSGHSGTLDPNVTGVLPVALGRGTKIVQLLLTAGKEYVAVMHLHKEVSEGKINSVFKEFTGKIKQLPPVRSSVKRQQRERSIYYINLLEIDNKEVLFRVGCQAGTYIRKLCHDIGKKLDVGAHMAELRRTKVASFNEESLATLHDVLDAYYYWKNEGNERYIRHVIQPVENAVVHLPKIFVRDSAVDSLCHGANLHLPGIAKLESGIIAGDLVAVMSLKGELVCYGTARMGSKEMLGEKGIAVKAERVFMLPGTYPKMER